MNNVVLVGRLTEEPKLINIESGKQVTSICVAVTRNYKNVDGIYESDFIRCVLWNGIAANTTEYCHTGDVIGIKGRLQSSKYEDENQKMHFITDVVAERVTFLSPSKKEEPKSNTKSPKTKKETSKKEE